MTPPTHLLLGPPRHGVRILAAQLAAEVTAPSVTGVRDAAGHDRVHLHLNDRLARPDDIRRLAAATCLTVTLHDVPQETDGNAFTRRRDAYREIVAAADGWAVSSEHEQSLAHQHLQPRADGLVAPLPVVPELGAAVAAGVGRPDWPAGRTAAVFGFVYPGKGHRELIAAAAAIRDRVEVTVLALGAVAPGHDDLVAELSEQAREAGVGFRVTGHLDDAAVTAALRRVDVAVCGHRNVSASGSTNLWLAAGRRPLVRDGRYARELAALRPGCYQLYVDDDLPAQLGAALDAPARTTLAPDADTRPHLPETAQLYRDWWRTR